MTQYTSGHNDDGSSPTEGSYSSDDEATIHFTTIIARAPDSINGDDNIDDNTVHPTDEVLDGLTTGTTANEPADTLNNDETFYVDATPNTEDDFFDMMSTHSHDAADEGNVPSTQGDTMMSPGRED